jgi:putative polyhydroxyalkanoate system protein
MSAITMTIQHGRSLPEARAQLEQLVQQVHRQFGAFVHRTDWSADRSAVKMSGTGFQAEVRVDAELVHVTADIALLNNLLQGPLASGLRQIVQQSFPKQLT